MKGDEELTHSTNGSSHGHRRVQVWPGAGNKKEEADNRKEEANIRKKKRTSEKTRGKQLWQ